jgi:hypothetical protein
LSAYHSALRARTSLEAARTVISNDLSNRQAFLSSAGRAKLASDIKTVEADADNASAILQGSFGMRVFRYVPYLNYQPNGIMSLVDDVHTTVSLSALQSLQRPSVADATTTMSNLRLLTRTTIRLPYSSMERAQGFTRYDPRPRPQP